MNPICLLIHGGGWNSGGPIAMDWADAWAKGEGFDTVKVPYTLFDLRKANDDVRNVASAYTTQGRSVVAYGDSVGGTMAALLAAEGRVEAAATNGAPMDLLRWSLPNGQTSPAYWASVKGDPWARREFSPFYTVHQAPVRAAHSKSDSVVGYALAQEYAARFFETALVTIEGSHVYCAMNSQDSTWGTRYMNATLDGLRWLRDRV